MRLFGRKHPTPLERLQGAAWRCDGCGDEHRGMFDIAAYAPDFWEGAEEPEPNCELRLDSDFLSEDFCVVGEHLFVRAVLEIPVHGLAEKFGFGMWSTLSRANFELYVDSFDEGSFADIGPWTGWFSNQIATFPETLNLPCWVYPQLDRQRPVIAVQDADHPLALAQEHGVTPERLLEIYAAYGHSLA
ncbi:MAG: DUF2199 domain-containing protein [Allosphingosinicella sp.]